jgi:hypothetical protein
MQDRDDRISSAGTSDEPFAADRPQQPDVAASRADLPQQPRLAERTVAPQERVVERADPLRDGRLDLQTSSIMARSIL